MDGKMFSKIIFLSILSTTVDTKVLLGCEIYAKCLLRLNDHTETEAKSICQRFTGVKDGQCDRKVRKQKTFNQEFVY